MLNRSASLAMSTIFLKALPGKLDIKRHEPSILNVSTFHILTGLFMTVQVFSFGPVHKMLVFLAYAQKPS